MAGAYYGDPGQGDNSLDSLSSLLPLFHAIRNRDLQDKQAENDMAVNLPIRQERMRAAFDPKTGMGRTTNPHVSTGITPANTEIATAVAPGLSPQEQANISLKKNDQQIDRERLTQQGKMGEERLGIQRSQERLNELKNENIHNQKEADMRRKVNETEQRLGLAHEDLLRKQNDTTAHINFNKAQMDSTEARHALERILKDKEIKNTKDLHDAQIKELGQRHEDTIRSLGYEYDDQGRLIKATERKEKENPAFKSVTTQRFQSKDGKNTWNIPVDKLDAFKKANPEAVGIESR